MTDEITTTTTTTKTEPVAVLSAGGRTTVAKRVAAIEQLITLRTPILNELGKDVKELRDDHKETQLDVAEIKKIMRDAGLHNGGISAIKTLAGVSEELKVVAKSAPDLVKLAEAVPVITALAQTYVENQRSKDSWTVVRAELRERFKVLYSVRHWLGAIAAAVGGAVALPVAAHYVNLWFNHKP